MGKIKRIVSTGFWEDKKVTDEFSVEDRYFMLYLLTNPHTSQLGIYELSISTMSNETGYNRDVVKVLLDRFQNKYDVIRYSFVTGEIAIKNYLKHSIIKGGKPVYDCLLKEAKMVDDRSLLSYIYNSLSNKQIDNITVIDFLNYIEKEISNKEINNNNNDNDNERIVDESSKRFIPPTVDMVSEYCLERKNSVDPEEFVDFYTSKGWLIGKNKMKDWKAAVRTWERSSKPKKQETNVFDEWRNA